MLFYWLFWLIVPGWKDLILNPATGKISQKNLFGVMGFYVGTALSALVVLVQLYRKESVDTGPLAMLTVNGLGLGGLKVYQAQKNRETATPEGQPLAEPGSDPPKPMPQPYNPNAPANQEPV